MRWQEGELRQRARHTARLAHSARHFGFSFSEAAFCAEVRQVTALLPAAPHRVRLTLGPPGDVRVEAAPLEEARDSAPLRLALAEECARAADPFFRHKTTWRRVYQRAFRAARARGFDEALLLNERGEVTEGTRANLFVQKEGACYTPPVRCGLLAGIGRAVLLEEGRAEERVLTPADLHRADALYLVSALRGRRRAVLANKSEDHA